MDLTSSCCAQVCGQLQRTQESTHGIAGGQGADMVLMIFILMIILELGAKDLRADIS